MAYHLLALRHEGKAQGHQAAVTFALRSPGGRLVDTGGHLIFARGVVERGANLSRLGLRRLPVIRAKWE
jgi:hypothetical protein